MTNFDFITNFTIEALAQFLHNIQESAVKNQRVDDPTQWKIFLEKEVSDK